jgi:AcrR family transcriptional regulator
VTARAGHLTKNAEVKRQELIARAAALFDEVGYHAASVGELAEACGMRKPTLYHYFRSKDEVLYQIHDAFIDLLINREVARRSVDLSPRHALLEVMADILDLMRTHRGYVRVFFEHYRELPDEQKAAIKEKRDAYEAAVRGIIVAGVASGEFRDVDPRMTTLALAGMCNWAYQWYDPEGPLSTREVAQFFCRVVIDGIASNE